MVARIARRRRRQATASASATEVVAQAVAEEEMPVAAVTEPTTTSEVMNAVIAASEAIGLMSAGRRGAMRKYTPHWQKRSPPCCLPAPPSTIWAMFPSPIWVTFHSSTMHLSEDKLFIQLGDRDHGKCARWILDSGATNHMTGGQSVFIETDHKIQGSIHFGDGAVARIEGRGTILLKCKNGDHKVLTNVYLIPGLTTNIVSLGQLEEDGHKLMLHGGFPKI
jgi:hypothetical protein